MLVRAGTITSAP